MSDIDLDMQEDISWQFGPEEGDDEPLGFVPAVITGLAQLSSLVLFLAMVAVWAALGSGA